VHLEPLLPPGYAEGPKIVPTPLPPTVHERLARCGEQVFVDGIVAGSTVELTIDAVTLTATVHSASHTFGVPPLTGGAVVRARQDTGAGFSVFSPPVVVENAFVPPESAPTLPDVVGDCSQCVQVTHATPGAQLELRIGGHLVGGGTADRHGNACAGVDLRDRQGSGSTLMGRQVLCGEPGPEAGKQLTSLLGMPEPFIGAPLFGCQSVVSVSNARPGSVLRFETGYGANLGSLCSCWRDVDVGVLRPLAVGELVHVRCSYDAHPACAQVGPWSNLRLVEAPDERIKPEVLEALIEGDQVIRVAKQIAGASLLVRIASAAGAVPDEFGPRPTSTELEIALAAPLAAGDVVTVVQTLCGVSMESDPVTVQPLPAVIATPVIVPPLYACGQAVQVSNLQPGALVRLFLDGIVVGIGWAGLRSSITISTAPALAAHRSVTAIQWLGGTASSPSDLVEVLPLSWLLPPRILGPLAVGDEAVLVSGVTPGAHVSIISQGDVIGAIDAAEPIVSVPITPLANERGTALARVSLCGATANASQLTSAILSPSSIPANLQVTESTVELGDLAVPSVQDGGGYTIQLRGQLYSSGQGTVPLVIIAHGYFPYDDVESFKGYSYLAHHLVNWGMAVFSIDLQQVNDLTPDASFPLQQFARAEIILQTITALQAANLSGVNIDFDRIGLVGHSVSGEAVALAHFVNVSQSRGFGVRGVVSIAPTRWHPEVVIPAGQYLQLYGSLDMLTYLVLPHDTPLAGGGMRIYDKAERDKTLFWVYGLRHNPFNTEWVSVAGMDVGETYLENIALPGAEHERTAKCLINAFFQANLRGDERYRGYMEGTLYPQDLRHLQIHASCSRQPRQVLDNFGDADTQVGIAAELPLDKTVNSRNQPVAASGSGLGDWEDVQLVTVPHSPHSTAGTLLSWIGQPAEYRTTAGGIAGAIQDVLTLRLAQFLNDDSLNPVAMPADLFVALSDGTQEALVRLGAVAEIPYPDATAVALSMMRTVRLPLDAFRSANPNLNLGNIQSITLRFMARPTGHIIGDDFEVGP
jgi:hypothetical protein